MTLTFVEMSFEVMSTIASHWLSRKLLEIEAWFQRTTNRKWPMRNRMVTWLMTLCDHGQVVIPMRLKPNISKTVGLLEMLFSNNR